MIPLLLVLLVGACVWLSIRVRTLGQELDSLRRLLARLEIDLHKLKQSSAVAPELPAPAPQAEATSARLSQPSSARQRVPVPIAAAAAPVPPVLPTVTPQKRPSAFEPVHARTEPTHAMPPQLAASPAAPRGEPLSEKSKTLAVDWEQFMGVKLFAWIGGFLLFLAVAFLIKLSIDRNWISPELRVATGFITGFSLLMGGIVLRRKAYVVTSQTFCATGILILYAVTYACHGYYHFTGPATSFALMAAITVAAFFVAVRLEAQVVGVLGLVGGFLTPVLISTGVDRPLALFTYIGLLDVGLLAVAFHRRWHYLILLGAIGTVLMEMAWVSRFFEPEKVWIAFAIFLTFKLLFLMADLAAERLKQANAWLDGASLAVPFFSLTFSLYLLWHPELGSQPGVFFCFLAAADLCILATVILRPQLNLAQVFAGGGVFLALSLWTIRYLTSDLLSWALGGYFGFALLHTVFPLVLQRFRPEVLTSWWSHAFAPLALILTVLPLVKLSEVPFGLWPVVLLIDLLAVGLAVVTFSFLAMGVALVLTILLVAVWVLQTPADVMQVPQLIAVIGGFAFFFFISAIFLARRQERSDGERSRWPLGTPAPFSDEAARQLPSMAAALPFVLLMLASGRLPLENPSAIFGLALLLVLMQLGMVWMTGLDALALLALGSVVGLEFVWHAQHFNPAQPGIPLAWTLLFSAVFIVFPFLFRKKEQLLPWIAAALSGPLHYYLAHRAVKLGYAPSAMGLLPAMFAVPMLLALLYVVRRVAVECPARLNLLAWFGGSALFFITLIFPVQFDRQWITIGWALEGAALIWLFRRVPHPGLRAVGVVLLMIAFVRLALNPAVLTDYPRSATRIVNWYLYTYGIVTACLIAAAQLLAPPRHLIQATHVRPLLYTLATVLAFLLLNIEIADYFATGPRLTFHFSAGLGQDMTYSIAWALFALVLVMLGIWNRVAPARYAGLALLGATLIKLLAHDLRQLEALYRIGAFLGVAVVLILASVIYQRFLSQTGMSAATEPESSSSKSH
ncbi:MAG: DUF2339 domain-containing protein [Verrucomicrobiota bacterium]